MIELSRPSYLGKHFIGSSWDRVEWDDIVVLDGCTGRSLFVPQAEKPERNDESNECNTSNSSSNNGTQVGGRRRSGGKGSTSASGSARRLGRA